MAWLGRRTDPPELKRIEAARSAVRRHGEPRPIVVHSIDKIEDAVTRALADCTRISESLEDFDQDRIGNELKAALRTKSRPTDPDTPQILSLRRRHEAVHALRNRLEERTADIDRALVDLETFVAERAMAAATSDEAFADLQHWVDVLDRDAQALLGAPSDSTEEF